MTTQTTTAEKSPVVQGLSTLLANSYALMGQTHLAHWNVEGSNFFGLHAALQTQYEEIFTAIDGIAERIRALGVYAPGGLKTLAAASRIVEMTSEAAPCKDFVTHLISCHETLLQDARELRGASEQSGDLETQDLVIERIQAHQKTLWMLKSFLRNL